MNKVKKKKKLIQKQLRGKTVKTGAAGRAHYALSGQVIIEAGSAVLC